MSRSEKSYPLTDALQWAEKCRLELERFAEPERIQVVGSLRRQKALVHDIEILMIPKQTTLKDLFGKTLSGCNMLDENITWLAFKLGAILFVDGPKIKKLKLREGPVLEIYISTPKRWAVEMVIKTGDEDFSHKCVTTRRQSGYLPSDCVIKDGWQVYRGERVIPMPDEGSFLQFLGFSPDLSPEIRSGQLVPGVSVETRPA